MQSTGENNKRSSKGTETTTRRKTLLHYSPQEMVCLGLGYNSLSREECAAILLGGAKTHEPDQSLISYGTRWLTGKT